MSLPSSWVDSLFARIAVRYGAAWLRMWDGVDVSLVKADWAEELAGFENNPAAIKHALDNLPPDRPPNVTQFKALCVNRPQPLPPLLPAPKPTPEAKAAIREKLKLARESITRHA